MAEVKQEETFNCTPQEFFNIIKDYARYPEFLKDVKSCRVVEDKGTEKLVEYKISIVKDITYINKHFEKEPQMITWKFVEGDLFKTMEGGWKLEDVGGKTKATYLLRGEFSLFVPSMLVKTALAANLPSMMKAYHQRVKELYGK